MVVVWVLAGFQFQYWSWISDWVSEVGWISVFCWIGIVGCWIGVGRLIDGGFLNQFRWLELVWIDESGGDKEIRLVVAFWVGFSCWVLHFESLWVSIITVLINGWSLFELIWRVVKPWRLDWWWVFFLLSNFEHPFGPCSHSDPNSHHRHWQLGHRRTRTSSKTQWTRTSSKKPIASSPRSSLTPSHRTWSTNKISVSIFVSKKRRRRRRKKKRRSNGSIKEPIETVLFFFYNSITQALSKPHNLSSLKKFKP